MRHPSITYCQGLNFLAAFLLIFFEEENAFWMLNAIVEKFLPADYFTQSMIGLQADVQVLLRLLTLRLPRIANHLRNVECMSLEGIASGWLLCLFIKTLPIETTLRVWDAGIIFKRCYFARAFISCFA